MRFILLLLFLVSDVALGDFMLTPKGKEVSIYKDATKKSEVIGKVTDVVEADERVGLFFRLSTGGYVSALDVRPSSSGNLQDNINKLFKQGKELDESRQRSMAMGIRGLDEEDLSGAAFVKPNLRAVFKMEEARMSIDIGASIYKEIKSRSGD